MAKRVDSNQPQVTKELRNHKFSVGITSNLGHGFPDMAVGFGDCLNMLIELKTDEKKKLTEDELKFFDRWNGRVDRCCSTLEIIESFQDMLSDIVFRSDELHRQLKSLRETELLRVKDGGISNE